MASVQSVPKEHNEGELSDYIDENFDDDETDELWGGYRKMPCP